MNRPTSVLLSIVFTLSSNAVTAARCSDDVRVEQLVPLGGHWYLGPGEPPTYYYKDSERCVDLFSYHRLDSNDDGIANISISHNDQYLIIRSQGYPNHPTAIFPNTENPNSIEIQDFLFRFPLEPQLAEQFTQVPMGPIAMAINGVVFFNPFEAGGMNAVAGYSEVWLDSCCGHPQQTGVYHYHKYPSCVKSPFPDDGLQHSPILGIAFDGFPIYGPYESAGLKAKDITGEQALDVCNGHTDPARGYHYHVTPGRFPYIIGGYAGLPETSNSPLLSRRSESGAIRDNASGTSKLAPAIQSVTPGIGQRGTTLIVRINLDSDSKIPQGRPSWVQIGPFEGSKIERPNDSTIITELRIPGEASLGLWLDCHIEFAETAELDRTLVYKKNNAFRVVE